MTGIYCDVPTSEVLAAVVPMAGVPTAGVAAAAPPARPGVSSLRPVAFLGTSVPGAVDLDVPVGLVRPVTHVRTNAAAVALVALMAQDGQTNNYIQMTSVFVSGEGASGPPPDREPA